MTCLRHDNALALEHTAVRGPSVPTHPASPFLRRLLLSQRSDLVDEKPTRRHGPPGTVECGLGTFVPSIGG